MVFAWTVQASDFQQSRALLQPALPAFMVVVARPFSTYHKTMQDRFIRRGGFDGCNQLSVLQHINHIANRQDFRQPVRYENDGSLPLQAIDQSKKSGLILYIESRGRFIEKHQGMLDAQKVSRR